MLLGLSRSTILAFAAILFAVGVVSWFPDRAEATCGSHVLVVNASSGSERHEAPMPAKCTGPNCGQAPLPIAPVSIPTADPNELGPLAVIGSERIPRSFRSAAAAAFNDPDFNAAYPTEIFHPPRCSPSI